MYPHGKGLSQVYVPAYKWFNLSAAQGYDIADQNRDIAASHMTRSQLAEAQRAGGSRRNSEKALQPPRRRCCGHRPSNLR
ncbi:MAG: hypothetical protein GY798_06440 [Hyphomicrobiales bacterium]|nr:hypothetical protein [Hyphomicrobiales bacterium]